MKKNTIAKLLTAALCTGLIAGMTTGCGSASSASGENGTRILPSQVSGLASVFVMA